MEASAEPVSLTSLAVAGGCAAKYAAGRLEELLAGLVPADAENLLVGLDPADDAAVYRLDDERALVFTVDFFPPVVDDPADFGAIAATNALNDVYAMGGLPLLALSVAAFPEELPTELLAAIMRRRGRGGARCGRDSRRRAHDPRRRAEVRARRCRHGRAGRRLAEVHGPARAMRFCSRSRSAPGSCCTATSAGWSATRSATRPFARCGR